MSERKDKRDEQPIGQRPDVTAGILKEKEKRELEDRVVNTLRSLNSKLTRKEIIELFNRVEVAKGLEGLKQQLEKEKKLGGKEISEDILKILLDLIKESKEITQKGIEELRIELRRLNRSPVYEVNRNIYPTSKFPWIKRFEESELGKNLIMDIGGFTLGLADSAQAIFMLLLGLVKDLFLLPKHLMERSTGNKKGS